MEIREDLVPFLMSGVSLLVGTRDAELVRTTFDADAGAASTHVLASGPMSLFDVATSPAGSVFVIVQNGDMIELDVAKRTINMLVDDQELERRRAQWKPPATPKRGYYKLYAQHVMQADKGCDFDFLQDETLQG